MRLHQAGFLHQSVNDIIFCLFYETVFCISNKAAEQTWNLIVGGDGYPVMSLIQLHRLHYKAGSSNMRRKVYCAGLRVCDWMCEASAPDGQSLMRCFHYSWFKENRVLYKTGSIKDEALISGPQIFTAVVMTADCCIVFFFIVFFFFFFPVGSISTEIINIWFLSMLSLHSSLLHIIHMHLF